MFENLHQNQKIAIAILVIISLTFFILTLYFALRKTNCPPGGDSCKPAAFVRFSNIGSKDSWPWTKATWYKYSYADPPNYKEGTQSDKSSMVSSPTDTNPIIKVIINSLYSINVYRAIDDGTGNPGPFTLLGGAIIGSDGTFTDTQNPAPQPPPPPPDTPPTPNKSPTFISWGSGGGGGNCGDTTTFPHCTANGCDGNQCQKGKGNALCTVGNAMGGCALPSDWEKPASGCTLYCMADQ
jgi:hypothetical protein